MSGKTPVSNASTYQDIGSFWDEHDATEFGEQTISHFEVNVESQRRYYPVDRDLSFKIRRIAEQHGVSEETLLNIWVQEKIDQIHAADEEDSLIGSPGVSLPQLPRHPACGSARGASSGCERVTIA